MLRTFADSWFVSALPSAIALGMAAASMLRSRMVMQMLDGVIYDEEDLGPVRPAILMSMRLTWAYIALMLVFATSLLALVSFDTMSPGLAGAHVAVFGLVTLPAGMAAKAMEQRLRSLRVVSHDSGVEAAYRLWLTMWDQPRLRLPH